MSTFTCANCAAHCPLELGLRTANSEQNTNNPRPAAAGEARGGRDVSLLLARCHGSCVCAVWQPKFLTIPSSVIQYKLTTSALTQEIQSSLNTVQYEIQYIVRAVHYLQLVTL